MGVIKQEIYWPDTLLKDNSVVKEDVYIEGDKDPIKFWGRLAVEGIKWSKPFDNIYGEENPFFKWFIGGKLNISSNCLDRHLEKFGDKTALIWVAEPVEHRWMTYTYRQLHEAVCKFANVLKSEGVKKGDVVSIYLPLIPETVISMLACARIGAIHSVVFSAFSSEALKSRINDNGAKVLITADGYYRKGKPENLKVKADEAIQGTGVQRVIVVKRAHIPVQMNDKDRYFWDLAEKASAECNAEEMDSEDPLFILYTSGTTGKPKGVVHVTGGYAVQTLYTTKWNFNLKEDDIIWTTADIGWVTGHSYMCYGPLLNGATTLFYEGAIDYPDPSRVWSIIQQFKVNIFYTAPTALRMFRLFGDEWHQRHDLSSLKCIATVGEPIDQKTWMWFFENIGKSKLPLIDTWWQTETGGTMINALAGLGPYIPGVAGRPIPGTKFAICNDKGKIIPEGEGYLVQVSPFSPGTLRTVWGSKERYIEKYFTIEETGKVIKNYVSGDAASFDGRYFKILGRTDDAIKVAGHRLSTAEMEDMVHKDKRVVDVAVVGKADAIKGSVPVVFVKVKEGGDVIVKEASRLIEEGIGHFAKPALVFVVPDLPKTRSGKIMRRVLRALLKNESPGDISTLVNPDCVEEINKIVNQPTAGK